MNKGLYIHIPFCKSKCKYCDFSSYSGKESIMPEYFSCLQKELLSYKDIFFEKGYKISSVFVGGGTPTFVDEKYIVNIMNLINENFNVLKDAEISIEANPGTVRKESLEKYFLCGINRISFGLQSADKTELKMLGRIHGFSDFKESVNLAREAGFSNINADLIIGVPKQDWKSLYNTLELVTDCDTEHISCYSLIVEENTPFYDMQKSNELEMPDENEERIMYHNTIFYLKEKGYNHYEISNFSKNGYECKHNILYWKAKEYIGIGASSQSYFEGVRYSNAGDLADYIKAIKTCHGLHDSKDVISKEESMKEFMMLGLRMIKGVSSQEFKKIYGVDMFDIFHDEINKLKNMNLIESCDDCIRLTKKGLDYANIAFMEFV